MPMYNRGGKTLTTGLVGRFHVLRQHLMLPGERIMPKVKGNVRVSALREEATVYLNAKIDAFATPLRWLWPQLPEYIKQGPGTALSFPTESLTARQSRNLGIGDASRSPAFRFWRLAPERIFNEWYRWPEDGDSTGINMWGDNVGPPLVNLPRAATRLQADLGARDADTMLTTSAHGNRERIDVRGLAEIQSRFRQAMEREWLAHGRYIELLKELWNADGSREVDQVPMRLSDGASLGVNPMDRYATDGDSLGELMSLHNFDLFHSWRGFAAPEHMVVTYVLCLRFTPVFEQSVSPHAGPSGRHYSTIVGDPGLLAARRPQPVQHRHLFGGEILNGGTVRGYLPAGWEWRDGHDCIGQTISDRNSFPLLQHLALTPAQMRDASRINNAFRSTSLGHYTVDADFSISVDSPIPGPKSSIFAGTGDAGRGSSYPYPGPAKVS